MESIKSPRKLNVMKTVLFLALAFLSAESVYGRNFHHRLRGRHHHHHLKGYFPYSVVSCRAHTASIIDCGGVGDGKTSNTKAFQTGIDHLGQYGSRNGGSLLYVPPGRYLTGSFNLTSHFTLFLQRNAVLLATQDENEWPVIEPLPEIERDEGKSYVNGPYDFSLNYINGPCDLKIRNYPSL